MKRIVWTAGAMVGASVLWFGTTRVEWQLFGSDETTTRVSSMKMLSGRSFLALYSQYMWDAVIWSVIETSTTPPASVSALNAEIKTTGRIVAQRSQLGFQGAQYSLIAISDSSARLCAGAECATIVCSAKAGCLEQSPQLNSPVAR